MTTLEKAAKAMWDAREELMPERTRQAWHEGTPLARTTVGVMLLAALKALREPDEEMCQAAREAGYLFGIDRAESDAIAWTFEAMIDAMTNPTTNPTANHGSEM